MAPSGTADAETGDGTVEEGEEPPAEDEGGEESPAPPAAGSAQERLDLALTDMDAAVADAETAMADGNWTAYGEAQERMADALERAIAANQEFDDPEFRSLRRRSRLTDRQTQDARPAPVLHRIRPGVPASRQVNGP